MASPVPVRQAMKSLSRKGFRQDDRDHSRYTYHDAQGRKTASYVYFSRGGAASKEVGDTLLKRMMRELGLGRIQDVRGLLDCSMNEVEFVAACRGVQAEGD